MDFVSAHRGVGNVLTAVKEPGNRLSIFVYSSSLEMRGSELRVIFMRYIKKVRKLVIFSMNVSARLDLF